MAHPCPQDLTKHKKQGMKRLRLALCLLLNLFLMGSLLAQESNGRAARIRLLDGTELSGAVLSEDKDNIIIESSSLGKLNIARNKISALEYYSKNPGAGWFSTRTGGRNIFSPVTGFGPGKGEGYYQNFMLFANQAFFGATRHFSIGMGVEFASLVGGSSEFPSIAFYPKFTLPVVENKFQVGLGAIVSHLSEYGASTFDFSCYYAALTYGSPDRHFSVGLAYTHEDGDFQPAPIYILGGQYRLSRRFALTSDNWIADPLQGSLLTFGGRILGQKASWDLALMVVVDNSFTFGADLYPVPLLGVTVPFR